MKTVLILGIASDIGRELAVRFARDGWRVIGTHRGAPRGAPAGVDWTLLQCDLSSRESVDSAISAYRKCDVRWDFLILAAGTEEPIGPFFETDSNTWESGFSVNSLAPLRFLRGVHALRNTGAPASVAMFAGAGTNAAAPAYSAYCASKILLIKMCELLDAECRDTSFFIVGPGIVRTKIHDQTLAAGEKGGANLQKVESFLKSDDPGTSHEDIFACLKWCLEAGKATVGGRNISLVNDEWRNGGIPLALALNNDTNLYKLRRHGNGFKPGSQLK